MDRGKIYADRLAELLGRDPTGPKDIRQVLRVVAGELRLDLRRAIEAHDLFVAFAHLSRSSPARAELWSRAASLCPELSPGRTDGRREEAAHA